MGGTTSASASEHAPVKDPSCVTCTIDVPGQASVPNVQVRFTNLEPPKKPKGRKFAFMSFTDNKAKKLPCAVFTVRGEDKRLYVSDRTTASLRDVLSAMANIQLQSKLGSPEVIHAAVTDLLRACAKDRSTFLDAVFMLEPDMSLNNCYLDIYVAADQPIKFTIKTFSGFQVSTVLTMSDFSAVPAGLCDDGFSLDIPKVRSIVSSFLRGAVGERERGGEKREGGDGDGDGDGGVGGGSAGPGGPGPGPAGHTSEP